ncbi:MAG: dTDP-4-dehydrorhamnose reductase [Halioglobus sp.]
MKQTVLITGAGGQLGQELLRSSAPGLNVIAAGRSELDITDERAVALFFDQHRPSLVINAAAYTAVDRAESEPQLALQGNALAPEILARCCRGAGARMVHVSTDFVFDGFSDRPWLPDDTPAPVSVYGKTKLAGEVAVQKELPGALIIRTGWVYSCFGNNFVKTMLTLMAQREELKVVDDQVGTPTWAKGLAEAIWAGVQRNVSGVYHWSDDGVCSWYDFALAISEEAQELGLLPDKELRILPIPGTEYPTPAARPAYSVLDKRASWRDFAIEGTHWRAQLRAMLAELKDRNL